MPPSRQSAIKQEEAAQRQWHRGTKHAKAESGWQQADGSGQYVRFPAPLFPCSPAPSLPPPTRKKRELGAHTKQPQNDATRALHAACKSHTGTRSGAAERCLTFCNLQPAICNSHFAVFILHSATPRAPALPVPNPTSNIRHPTPSPSPNPEKLEFRAQKRGAKNRT